MIGRQQGKGRVAGRQASQAKARRQTLEAKNISVSACSSGRGYEKDSFNELLQGKNTLKEVNLGEF